MHSANAPQRPPITMLMATSEHLPIIATILREVREWLQAQGIRQWVRPFTAEWIAEHIRANEFYVGYYNGQVVGTLRFLWSDVLCWAEDRGDAGYVHTLVVRRNYAELGLGRHMLVWAECLALSRNKPYLRLDCLAESATMRQYYQNAGFRPVREVDLEAYGERILLLEKPLVEERTTT